MFARVIKFFIALALLPLLAGEVYTLVDVAHLAWSTGPGVASGKLWFSQNAWLVSLGIGFVTWILVFIFLPRTMWLYVLGHEFTHAVMAMLAGGKVSAFKVTSSGGHVMTDRVNWWIALSPYFVPIYALIWICCWLTVDFYYPLRAWQPILYFGIGLFWAFHLTFTVSMCHSRQTDLSGEGYVFSGVIILIMNFLAVLLLLSIVAHDMSGTARLFSHRIGQAYGITWALILKAAAWAQTAWKNHHI